MAQNFIPKFSGRASSMCIVHCEVMFSFFRILEYNKILDKGGSTLSTLNLVLYKDQPRSFCVLNGGTNLNVDVVIPARDPSLALTLLQEALGIPTVSADVVSSC